MTIQLVKDDHKGADNSMFCYKPTENFFKKIFSFHSVYSNGVSSY